MILASLKKIHTLVSTDIFKTTYPFILQYKLDEVVNEYKLVQKYQFGIQSVFDNEVYTFVIFPHEFNNESELFSILDLKLESVGQFFKKRNEEKIAAANQLKIWDSKEPF